VSKRTVQTSQPTLAKQPHSNLDHIMLPPGQFLWSTWFRLGLNWLVSASEVFNPYHSVAAIRGMHIHEPNPGSAQCKIWKTKRPSRPSTCDLRQWLFISAHLAEPSDVTVWRHRVVELNEDCVYACCNNGKVIFNHCQSFLLRSITAARLIGTTSYSVGPVQISVRDRQPWCLPPDKCHDRLLQIRPRPFPSIAFQVHHLIIIQWLTLHRVINSVVK
jgi:hypothetical protein